jgi:glutathione S-transferase
MQLVGRTLSPFVRRVATSLHLLDLPYEQIPLATATDGERIRQYNPLGRVPALVLDDGSILIDSTAILDHIDEIAGPDRALLPRHGAERRRALHAVFLTLGALDKAIIAVAERTKRPEETIHRPWLDFIEGQVSAGLGALDAEAGSGWRVGDRLTQADVTVAVAYGFLGRFLPHLRPDGRYPRLEAHAARCEALPAFQATLFRG